jgi:iron complex outermembrane receptor protein
MSFVSKFPRGFRRFSLLLAALPLAMGTANAQEDSDDDGPLEEIITVGTQIRGANISEALAVSVVTSQDIEDLGIDSGDELLQFMAEQGSNFFAESENISGGVNAARGDIGAFNLRNLGTGNTLVLLNGRRLVNAAAYQTEAVGGSFIPVNTVNSQSMPVFGLERMEVLRDGASAIYGADAVAGVVNYVMKDDFEGFNVRARYADWEGLPRNDYKISFEFGKDFNGGRTNFSVFGSYYDRQPVNSQDDSKWADDDFRRLIPAGSPFEGDTSFRRSSANSEYGQYDVSDSVAGIGDPNDFFDGNGEFNTYPVGDPNCEFTDPQYPNVCFAADGNDIYRYNNNRDRDLYSDLSRTHLYASLNHEFKSGMESFTEVSAYLSDTFTVRHASTRLSAVSKYSIAPDAYWNPLGACGSSARLPDSIIGTDVPCEGLEMVLDNYRWTDAPRLVDNDGETFRILTGLRGQMGDWDWEGAASWSRASKEDITHNRISNTLLQEALNDPTPAGYNAFSGAIDTNIDRMLIDVRRDNETELTTLDFRMSKPDIFELPAGPVGLLGGIEWREESFLDERDPRLNGGINFVDNSGNTFPFVSDVVNSSPTSDSSGSRDVVSVFGEMQVPVFSNLDVQLALRYEDFSDVGDTTVGKIAFGWRVFEPLLIRGSWSQAYRVPNLVTVNESGVARSNTRDDFVCFQADPDEDLLDCRYGMQRTAGGSDDLIPEQSDNTSIGLVWDATDNLTFTVDYWKIEKEDTIGLFGEENHTALDLLFLLEQGTANCASVVGNPAIVRGDPAGLDPDEAQLYLDAGICPSAAVSRVDDKYQNLDSRNVSGHDIAVYYNFDTFMGNWNFRYVAAFLDEYEQVASGPAQLLLDAKESGVLPADVPVVGFADLMRLNGNPREKQTIRVRWTRNDWGVSLTGTYTGSVIETRPGVGSDGSPWILPSYQTYNTSVDYSFGTFGETDARVRLGMNNVLDERAPLSSSRFGYFSDVHTDLGRSFYADIRLSF